MSRRTLQDTRCASCARLYETINGWFCPLWRKEIRDGAKTCPSYMANNNNSH